MNLKRGSRDKLATRAMQKTRESQGRLVSGIAAVGLIIGTLFPWAMIRIDTDTAYGLIGVGGISLYPVQIWPGPAFIVLGGLILIGAILPKNNDQLYLHLLFGIRLAIALIAVGLAIVLVRLTTYPNPELEALQSGEQAVSTVLMWIGTPITLGSAAVCFIATLQRWISAARIAGWKTNE